MLACGPGALLSHRDAAALWGLRPPGSGDIDVTVPDSDLEARFHHLCRRARLVTPIVNAGMALPDGRWIRPDARWPDHRLIVEVDGYAVHRRRRAFRSDRVRDADLQELDYIVVRITEEDLDEPAALLARLRRLLYTRAPRSAGSTLSP